MITKDMCKKAQEIAEICTFDEIMRHLKDHDNILKPVIDQRTIYTIALCAAKDPDGFDPDTWITKEKK